MEENKLVMTKEDLTKYVDEIAWMERSAFTLEETADAYTKRGIEVLKAAQQQLNRTQQRLNQKNEKVENLENEIKKTKKSTASAIAFEILDQVFRRFIPLALLGIVVYIAVAIAVGLNTDIFVEPVWFFVPWVVFCLVVVTIWSCVKVSSKKKKEIKKSEQSKSQTQNSANTLQSSAQQYEEALEIAKREKEILDSEAARCRQAASDIRDQLDRMYVMDVIPPDYRYFDCILVLNQIFRNDLADNMREAVDLYEERVFRGEVLKGVRNIYSRLEKMNASMSYMVNDLREVQREVGAMDRNMAQISQRISRGEVNRLAAVREVQSARYAAEAVERSRERCNEYINNHR